MSFLNIKDPERCFFDSVEKITLYIYIFQRKEEYIAAKRAKANEVEENEVEKSENESKSEVSSPQNETKSNSSAKSSSRGQVQKRHSEGSIDTRMCSTSIPQFQRTPSPMTDHEIYSSDINTMQTTECKKTGYKFILATM